MKLSKKSPLLTEESFRYVPKSSIRFELSDNKGSFFQASGVNKNLSLKLINKCIEVSPKPFTVGITTFGGMPELYLTPNGYSNRPYLFNRKDADGTNIIYFYMDKQTKTLLKKVAKLLNTNENAVVVLALMYEYAPKEAVNGDFKDFLSFANVLSPLGFQLEDNNIDESQMDDQDTNTKDLTRRDMTDALLATLDQPELCMQGVYNDFRTKYMIENQLKRKAAKDNPIKKYYKLSSYNVDGQLVNHLYLPNTFDQSNLELFYFKNLTVFKGVYKLVVDNPDYECEYDFYPTISSQKDGENKTQLHLPKKLKQWIARLTGVSKRLRLGFIQQALINTLPQLNTVKSGSRRNKEEEEAIAKLKAFLVASHVFDQPQELYQNEVRVKRVW